MEIKNCKFSNFNKINLKVDASAFYPGLEQYYGEGNYPFIRVADVDNFIDYDNCIKIPDQIAETREFSTLKKVYEGDILITKGGSIGRVALVEKEAAVTRDLIFLNSSSIKDYEYKFLYIYLSTNFCNDLMIRISSRTAQPHLTLTLIKDLPIFNPSEKFKKYISNLYDISRNYRLNSMQLYSQAENLLLCELGLENFNPSNEKVSIKSLKESFLKTGRLDSEYYQPKYDEYLKKVFSYSGGYELLGECCNLKDKNFMPKNDERYQYIELANVKSNADIVDCEVLLGKELPTRARRKVETGDVIVSSIEGSLASCAIITEDYNNALCSTGFYVVRSDKLKSEYLLTIFKSFLIFNLMKRGCTGTILTNIAKDEFVKLPIPLVKKEVQDEIAGYIKQSMEYSKKAKELLEISTKSVEIAIDKDEQAAHNFLDRQTVEYYEERAVYFIRLAEFRLYEELGLFDELKPVNYTVKNLSESFGKTGRLDSEYYDKKYDILFEKLKKLNCKKLSDIAFLDRGEFISDSLYGTGDVLYIRGSNITSNIVDDECVNIDIDSSIYKNVNRNDIVFSMIGSVGELAIYSKDVNAIASNNLGIIRSGNREVNHNYLFLLLNSIVGQMQFEKYQTRTAQPKISLIDVSSFIIPIIEKEKQEKISTLLVDSENLRNESKVILKKAVKAVELAIEEGEEKALEFLSDRAS